MHRTTLARLATRRATGLIVAIALVSVPAVVLAGHQFPDVDANHPFHGEVSAIANAGITAGFNDGGYHPSESVTRQAMAAFMHRGFGRVGLAVDSAPSTATLIVAAPATSTGYVPVRQLTITVPGASNVFIPNQLVHLHGRVTFQTTMSSSSKGCPCEFAARVLDTTTNTATAAQYQAFHNESATALRWSFDIEGLLPAGPGAHTYQLEVSLTLRESGLQPAGFDLNSASLLSATTFPFGSTGGSTP